MKDRRACLIKPAGVAGAGSVSQSGVSKQLDAALRAQTAYVDRQVAGEGGAVLAEYALLCLRGPAESKIQKPKSKIEEIRVVYPGAVRAF